MGEKVKVSRFLAETLNILKNANFSDYGIIHHTAEGGEPYCSQHFEILRDFCGTDYDQLIEILGKGYEIYESPEEKALAYYNSFDTTPIGEATEKMAIRKFLNIAEIKFKGIND